MKGFFLIYSRNRKIESICAINLIKYKTLRFLYFNNTLRVIYPNCIMVKIRKIFTSLIFTCFIFFYYYKIIRSIALILLIINYILFLVCYLEGPVIVNKLLIITLVYAFERSVDVHVSSEAIGTVEVNDKFAMITFVEKVIV